MSDAAFSIRHCEVDFLTRREDCVTLATINRGIITSIATRKDMVMSTIRGDRSLIPVAP